MADASFFVRRKPYATEQVTVSTSVAVPTSSKVTNSAGGYTDGSTLVRWAVTFPATAAMVEVIGSNGLIYTLDGSTPTSTNGSRLGSGDVLTLAGTQKIANLKMVRSGASDATANITYYKE
jgi:hypothetical protein